MILLYFAAALTLSCLSSIYLVVQIWLFHNKEAIDRPDRSIQSKWRRLVIINVTFFIYKKLLLKELHKDIAEF